MITRPPRSTRTLPLFPYTTLVRSRGSLAAEYHGDDAAAVALDRAHEVEAGGAGIAGLDAVGAFIALQQPVVVAVGAALVGEGGGGAVVIVLRIVFHQCLGQPHLVARRALHAAVGEDGGVAEGEIGRAHV